MNFKYSLRTGSKKDVCPNCGKKTFVPFVETETNKEVANAGRCDREQNCGYFQKPESNKPIYVEKFVEIEKPVDYIPLEVVDQHFNRISTNNFSKFLVSKFGEEKTRLAEIAYTLGDKYHSVIFWQIDMNERVRTGKVMDYDFQTGKRTKDENGKAHISWMHKKGSNFKQCLFGLNIAKDQPKKAVGIVESEKTAIIMSIIEPKIIWMACGSLNGFKLEYLAPLRLRQIIAFPDKGCWEAWNKTAIELNERGFNITVNNVLEKNNDIKQGDDIADLYI